MDPQIKAFCALASVVITTIAFIPYIIGTWKIQGGNEIRPTISGFICWLAADATILGAMLATGDVSWQMIPYVVGALIVTILSIRKNLLLARLRNEKASWADAFSDWCTRDTVCLALVMVGIVIWVIKRDPDYAIYLVVFSTLIGTWAVIRPLYDDPYRESLFSWILFLIGGGFGVAAIPAWTVTGAVGPILFVVVQLAIVAFAARRLLPRFTCA